MGRSAIKMSLPTFLVALSFAQLSSSQEVNQANIPFYSLIFSERFPPTMNSGGRSTLAPDIRTNEINLETKEKKYLPSVFIPAKNKGLLKIETKKEEVTPSTFQQVMGIANNLKMALYDFADVTLIRSVVDLSFDGFSPQERLKGRSDVKKAKSNQALRNMMTYIVAGFMDKEDCKHRLLCELGNLIQPVKGKAIIFIMFDSIIPKSWTKFRRSVKVFEAGTREDSSCSIYKCDHEKQTVVERL